MEKKLIFTQKSIKPEKNCSHYYYPELVNKFDQDNSKFNFTDSFSSNWYDKDFHLKKFTKLRENLFKEIVEQLNLFFKKNIADDIWRIIIGPWFHFASEVFYNRVYSIKNLFFEGKYDEAVIGNPINERDFVSNNTLEFINKINEISWNYLIYKKIFDELKIDYSIINKNDDTDSNNSKLKNKKNILFSKIVDFYNKIILKKNNCLIVNTSLNKISEKFLLFRLFKLPLINFPDKFSENMEIFSNDLRIRFLKFYLKDKDTAEDKLIKTLLINSMPISIFENFEYFFNKISSDENLSNIRYIVTSQNYDSNEYFKFIAAVNKQKKNKLIYVQHGNVDGTSKYDSYDNTQLTCTHFFTWGYKYSSKQIPLFNVKVAGLKKYKKNNPIQDGLMFYGLNFPIRRFFWDVMNDYNKSFEDQFNLIENLSEKIQKKMKIKIHNTMTQFEKDKYKRYLQDKKISIPLLEKIKNQKNVKLSVFSYDSTGFYEHLSLNKPVIGFWKNPTEIVNQDAKYFYNNLIDAGIIFDDYKKLARFINEKWSNLDEWWLNKYTQKAINEFTLKFSIYEKNPEKIFASKIKAIINN